MRLLRHLLLLLAVLLFTSLPSTADEKLDSVLSLETGYLIKGLKNNGFGLGLSYEKLLPGDFLSLRGTFSHMTFLTSQEDVYCASVGISLFANYYPMKKGLEGLYLGAGCNTTFLNYFGDGKLPDGKSDTVINVGPLAGVKHTFRFRHGLPLLSGVTADAYTGWLFNISDSGKLADHLKYTDEGWVFGIKLKLILN